MSLSGVNTFSMLSGGILTTLVGNYLGIDNPMLAFMIASAGGMVMSKFNMLYNQTKDTLPPVIFLNKMMDKLYTKIGLKYFTVVVTRSENIVFNKLENYIMYKYSENFVFTKLSDQNHAKLMFTVQNAVFSRAIVDRYQNHDIFWQIQNGNEIHILSHTLGIAGIKDYIKEIMSSRYGINTITVHQPNIETTRSSDKNQDKNVDITKVSWSSFNIQTNKTFTNTILTDTVTRELVDDIRKFIENDEEYYNTKGIPYKRGYLLYGPPGTGKTSIIKSIASKYNMDIFLINMGEIKSEKELTMVFQGTRNCSDYHMVIFEDVDRCEFLSGNYRCQNNEETIRTLLNEFDGVLETPKRITILTANDKSPIEAIPALIRPGRIDKLINLDYCDVSQLNRLYNHFAASDQKSCLDSVKFKVAPAQVVKFILSNPMITPEEFESKLEEIGKITVSEKSLSSGLSHVRHRRPKRNLSENSRRLSRYKRDIRKMETHMKKYPVDIERKKALVTKLTEGIKKKRDQERLKKQREKEREKRVLKKNTKNKPGK